MKISASWLREYVALPEAPEGLETVLDRAGLTVEQSLRRGVNIPLVVIAQILESSPHPNADRLSVCRVDDGSGAPRQIVCGAKNYKVGDKVPLALPGAVLPGNFKIKVGKLRGVESQGMLCSARELELAEDAAGLLILPSDAPVGEPLAALYPEDTLLELEVTPNRPDCLGFLGIAREISAFTGAEFRPPGISPLPGIQEDAFSTVPACPFYSARRISGLKNEASPSWLASRLESVGLRPISAIVDVTNYVLMEFSQPLHAFDAAKVRGSLRIRFAVAGERFAALDDREYLLEPTDLVIADDAGPVALAGIMGGGHSGVGSETTDILLESAIFDPAHIRRTARRLDLHSDSSHRFERGVNPEGTLAASQRATELILSLCGGTSAPVILTAGQIPPHPAPISLRPERCRALLGAALPDEAITKSLVALGLEPLPEDQWRIPSHRLDLTREVDLIEEVARLVGMEAIPSRIVASPAPTTRADRLHDLQTRLRAALARNGFFEARTSALVSDALAAVHPSPVRLRNPLGDDQACLRPALVPGLLRSLTTNLRFGERAVRLFEIGKVFLPEGESMRLALVATGPVAPPSWQAPDPAMTDLFLLKGILASLLPADIQWIPAGAGTEEIARLTLLVAGQEIGGLAQLTPAAGRKWDATHPILTAELSMEALVGDQRKERLYTPISPFPATTRDIALILPKDVPYEQIRTSLGDAAEPLLADFAPFDVFQDPEGKRVPADSKSVAISLTFRSSERTLTTEEVNKAVARVKERLKATIKADFRE